MSSLSPQPIETKKAPEPVGPYNQAILAGDWLFCSGQIALDPSTGKMIGEGNIEAETRQVLKNLLAVLDAAGAQTSKVVRTTIYLIDLNDFNIVNQIYAEVFSKGISPSRACVQVAALPKGGRVEIDCVAWMG